MKVLFLCNGNACRSQLAAAYLKSIRPDIEVHSAGIRPVKKIHWKNHAIAWEIDLELGIPKHWITYEWETFDLIISLSKEAREQVQLEPMIYRPILDPMPWGKRKDFIKARDTIINMVDQLYLSIKEIK